MVHLVRRAAPAEIVDEASEVTAHTEAAALCAALSSDAAVEGMSTGRDNPAALWLGSHGRGRLHIPATAEPPWPRAHAAGQLAELVDVAVGLLCCFRG